MDGRPQQDRSGRREALRCPAETKRNDRVFSAKRQMSDWEHEAFQTENAPGVGNANFTIISKDKMGKPFVPSVFGEGASRVPDASPGKSALGKGWGLGGKGATERRPAEPCLLGDKGALRASTAEQRGVFPLKKKRNES